MVPHAPVLAAYLDTLEPRKAPERVIVARIEPAGLSRVQLERLALFAGKLVLDRLELAPVVPRRAIKRVDAEFDHAAARAENPIFLMPAQGHAVDIAEPDLVGFILRVGA